MFAGTAGIVIYCRLWHERIAADPFERTNRYGFGESACISHCPETPTKLYTTCNLVKTKINYPFGNGFILPMYGDPGNGLLLF